MRYLLALLILTILVACAELEPTADLTASTNQNIVTQNVTTEQTIDGLLQAAVPQPVSGLLQLRWNPTSKHRELVVIDSEGQLSPSHKPMVLGTNAEYAPSTAYSADGRALAIFEAEGQGCQPFAGGSSCYPSANMLHLLDIANWQETITPLPASGYAWPVAFSEDNSQIAFVYNSAASHELMIVDTATGSRLNQRPLAFPPSLLAYTADGQSLVVVGAEQGEQPGVSPPGATKIQLLDHATLEITWEQAFPDLLNGFWCMEDCDGGHSQLLSAMWTPAIVLAPDRQSLHIVHADSEQLTTVDLTRRTVKQITIEVAQSWFDQLLALGTDVAEAKGPVHGATRQATLSADGTHLFLTGQDYVATRDETNGYWDLETTSLGIQVIDVASGRILEQLDYEASQISLTPDGAYLLLHQYLDQGPVTTVLDAEKLERVGVVDDYDVVHTFQMDGHPALVGSRYTTKGVELAVVSMNTFTVTHTWLMGQQIAPIIAVTP